VSRFGVLGAGAVGTFLGARLAACGHEVVLVGRSSVLAPVQRDGLRWSDLEGPSGVLAADRVRVASDPSALADCEVVLLTTKAAALPVAAASLASCRGLVVGLQNGVTHPAVLSAALGPARARAGTVGWNVIWQGPGALRKTTSGPLVIEARADDPQVSSLLRAFRAAGLDARGANDIVPVLWTKLLLNLNNACNALSGKPLQAQLADRAWRRVVAACQREGLAAMAAAGLRPVRLGRLDPRVSARVLPLPDPVFRFLASSMIRIDPEARSSMADDLAAGRPTEIDCLNGEIVRLGAAHGVPTPVNARVVEAVRAIEAGTARRFSPGDLGPALDSTGALS
jgi:2-dehydropantoate 2-reductase